MITTDIFVSMSLWNFMPSSENFTQGTIKLGKPSFHVFTIWSTYSQNFKVNAWLGSHTQFSLFIMLMAFF